MIKIIYEFKQEPELYGRRFYPGEIASVNIFHTMVSADGQPASALEGKRLLWECRLSQWGGWSLEEQMLFLKFDQPDMLLSKGIHKPIFSTCLCKAQIWDSDLITNLRMSYFHWIYFSNVLSCFSRVWLFETPWTVACSLPGFSVHGILQARILEWVAVSSFRGSSWPRDRTHVSSFSCTGRRVLYHSCCLGSPTSPVPWRNRRAGKGPRESPVGALGRDFLH